MTANVAKWTSENVILTLNVRPNFPDVQFFGIFYMIFIYFYTISFIFIWFSMKSYIKCYKNAMKTCKNLLKPIKMLFWSPGWPPPRVHRLARPGWVGPPGPPSNNRPAAVRKGSFAGQKWASYRSYRDLSHTVRNPTKRFTSLDNQTIF